MIHSIDLIPTQTLVLILSKPTLDLFPASLTHQLKYESIVKQTMDAMSSLLFFKSDD